MSSVDIDGLSSDQIIRMTFHAVQDIKVTVAQQQIRVTQLETTVASLSQQVYTLQNTVNAREQESRKLSVRITGFPLTDEEKAATDGKFLSRAIYDRLLVPILNFAKSKSYIDRLPQLANTVSSCYRVGDPAAKVGSSPPIILKFCNDTVRLAILKSKRTSTPAPSVSEKAMGAVRYSINEDLTVNTYKKVRELLDDRRTKSVWTVEGRIRFTLPDDKKVYSVNSVFDSVDTIIHKIQK